MESAGWGGAVGPIFTAVDDRFKASVLLAGGMNLYPPDRPPESIPVNFMPRSTVPVLMVNGREDFLAPVETELRSFAYSDLPGPGEIAEKKETEDLGVTQLRFANNVRAISSHT